MTTWVLLRGLAREAGHWGDFAQRLRARLPAGDGVVALDLPGNGELWRERSPVSVSDMVHAARTRIGRPPPYVLVALSLGGMVALEWARRYPQDLAGCVLVNSSFADVSPFWHRLQPRAALTLLGLLRPGLSPRDRERRVLALTSNEPVEPAVLQRWIRCAENHPVSRANFLRQLRAAARFRAGANAPAVPLLLVASAQDRLASVQCSRALARRWGLPLQLHPTAGHDLPLDDPDWLLRRLFALRLRAEQG
jgi:pimeloyl-ACP methyl ester carboxylesterase